VAIGPHVWFMKHYQTQENWKKMQCPSIKSLAFWYGSDFFLLKKIYYAFIVEKFKKHILFNEVSSKNFKSLND